MEASLDRVDPLPVYVLVGGASRRFGAAKASHEVDGEPWALHVARRLALSEGLIVLVGDPPAGEAFAHTAVVPDAPNTPGPLGGLLAAIGDRESRWGPGRLCLASCDLVRPERAWLTPLLSASQIPSGMEGAAFRDAKGWQPFPSILHTRCLERLLKLAAQGVTSMQEAFEASRIAARPWEFQSAGPPQANTPESLRDLLGQS